MGRRYILVSDYLKAGGELQEGLKIYRGKSIKPESGCNLKSYGILHLKIHDGRELWGLKTGEASENSCNVSCPKL